MHHYSFPVVLISGGRLSEREAKRNSGGDVELDGTLTRSSPHFTGNNLGKGEGETGMGWFLAAGQVAKSGMASKS